ncbi:MAG TPA: class I SAM-dependent methyltransferase [Chloroflexi bacterium]|nr:class I SAM-dependent methyltransferase [Chloroflexota bacterium]
MTSSLHDDGLMEHVPCNLCGATEYTLRFPDTRMHSVNGSEQWTAFRCTHPGYGIHPPIVACSRCGHIYTNPRPRYDVIQHNYEIVEDPLYLQERGARKITFRHHLKNFQRYTGPADGRRLLDVGAYIGVFVETAIEAGWDAWGLEPSLWAVNYATEHGLSVVQGTLEDARFPPESFDALTMWDVIEHLADPLGQLEHCYRLLKPGGWIAVHTMDIESLFARLMGSRWPWLMEMHIHYFSRRTLGEVLEKAGFRVVRIRPEGRFLRLRYLTTRLRPYSAFLADVVDGLGRVTGLDKVPLPVNFGDLVTAYARRPD